MVNRKPLNDILEDLKFEYIKSFPSKISLLEGLTKNQNWELLADEYHKLKGTGKTYGFPQVSILCEKLEMFAKNKETQKKPLFETALLVLNNIVKAHENKVLYNLDEDPYFKILDQIKI